LGAHRSCVVHVWEGSAPCDGWASTERWPPLTLAGRGGDDRIVKALGRDAALNWGVTQLTHLAVVGAK